MTTEVHEEGGRSVTAASVERAISEYTELGQDAFLRKYAGGHGPKAHYLRFDGVLYPLKALYAAACTPEWHCNDFNTRRAVKGFTALGFEPITVHGADKTAVEETDVAEAEAALAAQEEEGQRMTREVQVLRRSAKLVAQAKQQREARCEVCEFDFEQNYGSLGRGYIECHHINPLSGRDGEGSVTQLDELAMLCANCHRMVHRSKPCLTIEELRNHIRLA